MNHSASQGHEITLIVDDAMAIRKVLQAGTQIWGMNCLVAESPRVALQILQETHIDVVVADIKMPEMNGIELCQIIKKRFDADVIVMTGYVEDFNYEDIIEQGASDFIQKPIRIAEFIARLKRVLNERAGRVKLKSALEDARLNAEKFQRAMEGIVQAISVAVEKRDPYTAGHQERVAELACAIGERMNLEKDELYGLRMASVIHDLGKITVPAGILSKPGRLSSLEYELIKSHVEAGYDILKQIEFPWPLAETIRQHHERMDGSGYPQGLKGDQIAISARILAVADVFETMATHRPYRPALGIKKALREISSKQGRLYDPDVARACVRLFQLRKYKLK